MAVANASPGGAVNAFWLLTTRERLSNGLEKLPHVKGFIDDRHPTLPVSFDSLSHRLGGGSSTKHNG
jgi:hypothetical protein